MKRLARQLGTGAEWRLGFWYPALVLYLGSCAMPSDVGYREDYIAVSGPWQIPPSTLAIGDQQHVTYTGAGPWIGTSGCGGTFLPGTDRLKNWLMANYPQISSIGGYSCRAIVGNSSRMSVHATGRAIDVMIPTTGGSADNTAGDAIGNYLIEHAEEIGVQYIIWDQWSWNASRSAGSKSRSYGGSHPHDDHLHVELSVDGANMRTAWFSGSMPPPTGGGTTPPPSTTPSWGGALVGQSFPAASVAWSLAPGEQFTGYFDLRNTGNQPWSPGSTFLATTQPRESASALAANWPAVNRAATVNQIVMPGQVGRFSFAIQAPTATGNYVQYFNLFQDNRYFDAPGDTGVQLQVSVVGGACPAGVNEIWTCNGTTGRHRCVVGNYESQPCPLGCMAGAEATCGVAATDADGDGSPSTVDCDDLNYFIHPGCRGPVRGWRRSKLRRQRPMRRRRYQRRACRPTTTKAISRRTPACRRCRRHRHRNSAQPRAESVLVVARRLAIALGLA